MADDIVQRLVPYFHSEQRMPAGMIRDVMDEIERLHSIGKSHYGPHHDPMWCPICDRAWPCPTWIQFFGEEVRRG